MKKILIALLSLAMLFSFAACDNSNDTPVDPDQPGDDVTISDVVVKNAMFDVMTDMASNIAAMMPKSDIIAVSGQTASFDDNMVLTVEKTITPAGEATPVVSARLVVTGIDSSAANTTGTASGSAKTVTLNSYSYEYNGYTMNSDGMNVEYTATINGYFTDDAAITASVYTENDVQHYTPSEALAAENIVLPSSSSGISLVIDGQTVTGRSLSYAWDQLIANKGSLVSFADFVDGVEAAAVTQFTPYATRIINFTDATSIYALINSAVAAGNNPNSVNLASFTHTYADGTATYTFTVLRDDLVLAKIGTDADDAVQIKGKTNSPITVTFSAEEPGTNPTSLAADSFTISGTFVAETYAGSPSGSYQNPVEFTTTLSGNFGKSGNDPNTVTVTIDGTSAEGVDLESQTPALDKNAKITATIPMGPVYVGGEDYATDKTDVVLEDGDVALSYSGTAWIATATSAAN